MHKNCYSAMPNLGVIALCLKFYSLNFVWNFNSENISLDQPVNSTQSALLLQVQMLLQCSAQKCAHYRYLITKLFLRTGHVIFRLSTIFPKVL
jgi:hypothetical protein